MTSTEFTYFLHGVIQATEGSPSPTTAQWSAICDALKSVFHKETPDRYGEASNNVQPFLLPFRVANVGELPSLSVISHTC